MNRPPRPIVKVLIATPLKTYLCRRFVFDLPTGFNREKRGLFVKIGHNAHRVTPYQVRNQRIVISLENLVNLPVDAKVTHRYRIKKAQ